MKTGEEIKKHWESGAPTTKGKTIKLLEVGALNCVFSATGLPIAKVLEVGCGEGRNLRSLAELYPNYEFEGIDFAEHSLKKAEANEVPAVFHRGDVRELKLHPDLAPAYDIVFTDRCLISMSSAAEQMRVIQQIADKTKPNGHVFLIENFVESHANQNWLRAAGGLPMREVPEYNLFLRIKEVIGWATAAGLVCAGTHEFGSLHDIVLYVLLPMIGVEPAYDHAVVQAAAALTAPFPASNMFGNFGQNRMVMFRKEASCGSEP